MSILGGTYLDLADECKRTNPDGSMADVIEMLTALNPIMEDANVMECNQGTTHLHTVRTGLPEVAWGRLYKGIKQGKGSYAQVTDTTGFVEGLSTVDERLLKLSKNPAALRLQEAQGFLEAIAQEVQRKFFYGSTASDPDQIRGLADRYSKLSGAKNSSQIVDAGGTGNDNTSVWFITWGNKNTSLLYPRGTQAGITREDKGSQRVTDADGNAFYVKEELFTQHCGVSDEDWRFTARIANIDVSDLRDGNVQMYNLMRKAYYKLHNRRPGEGRNFKIYMNREVLEALDAEASNATAGDNAVRLTRETVEGKEVLTYRGMEIRELDTSVLLNTEARVV